MSGNIPGGGAKRPGPDAAQRNAERNDRLADGQRAKEGAAGKVAAGKHQATDEETELRQDYQRLAQRQKDSEQQLARRPAAKPAYAGAEAPEGFQNPLMTQVEALKESLNEPESEDEDEFGRQRGDKNDGEDPSEEEREDPEDEKKKRIRTPTLFDLPEDEEKKLPHRPTGDKDYGIIQ